VVGQFFNSSWLDNSSTAGGWTILEQLLVGLNVTSCSLDSTSTAAGGTLLRLLLVGPYFI
jgi:hypothetical protein